MFHMRTFLSEECLSYFPAELPSHSVPKASSGAISRANMVACPLPVGVCERVRVSVYICVCVGGGSWISVAASEKLA